MKKEELKQLLSEMTLDEKINQLLQLPGTTYEDSVITGPAADLGIPEEIAYQAGSCLSVIGAKTLKEIQDKCVKAQPHNIPMLFMCDIINGYKTVYPIPLAQGCTFEPELVKECASMAAKESAVSGLHVTFSPMSDLVRDARWGRVMESTGEDTLINCQMTKAMVEGYQGENLKENGNIAACLKHFAAYGAPTAGRDYNNVELSERTFKEDYLPAYQAAVDAGVAMVMTSFNSHNRIPSSANKELMRDILRGDMGFEGVVISDWAAIQELLAHGIAADGKEAAKLAMEAGVDIDMVTNIYVNNLKKLVEEGTISEALIDEAVERILLLKNELGLFENPYKDADEEAEKEILLCEKHRALARECAEKSFVLLKNEDNLLPLPEKDTKIAFIGPYTDEKNIHGAWSFFNDPSDNVTIKEALEKQFGAGYFPTEKGCGILNPGQILNGFQALDNTTFTNEEAKEAKARAVELAKNADIVVLAIGEHKDATGEGASSAFIEIPEVQMSLLESVFAVNQNIVVVLFNGRPLDLRKVSGMSKAILDVWMPGTEGGNAIVNTLFGKCAPTGKLSMSFPYCVGQVPVFYNEFSTGRPFKGDYREGKFFSKYTDIPNEPLYPFGFGLTYTDFSYSPVTLSKEVLTQDGEVIASVCVTNTGKRKGTEVVQCYIRDLAGSVVRPVRALKAYEKITLEPGETKKVHFTITESMLRFYGSDMQYKSEAGAFKVFIGADSRTENEAEFTLQFLR